MPRSEVRMQIDCWREGLDGLDAHQKLMYWVVTSEPTINHAGVGAVRFTRWARNASLTEAEASKALEVLGETNHIIIDWDSEEVLVRTLIRHDKVAEQPYVLKSAIASALAVKSPKLREVLAQELRRLPPRRPDGVSRAGKPVVYPDPHAAADVLDPPGQRPLQEPLSKPFRDPSERVSEGSPNPSEKKAFETLRKGKGEGEGEGEGVPVGMYSSGVARASRTSAAHELVENYASTCHRRPPKSVLARLTPEVASLLESDWPDADIAAALTAWGAKGLDPKLFGSVAHEVVNGSRGKHLRAVPTIAAGADPASVNLTREQVAEIIGNESPPDPPEEIARAGHDAIREWWTDAAPEWHRDRHARAVARLATRA
jgi:hypothetical protein